MIFVTGGTHEQPFDRLVKYVDELKRDGIITEDVFIQTGYCTYKPRYCQWSKFVSYKEMITKVEQARVVITHGGPSSFIMPLQIGKTPIVVPRQQKYGEHINDHQLEFVKLVDERMKTIIPVYDICRLKEAVLNHGDINKDKAEVVTSNNSRFNQALGKIIDEILVRENGKS